jgi:hypothetical protein
MKTPVKIVLAVGAAIGAGYLFKMSNEPKIAATSKKDESYKGMAKVEVGKTRGVPDADIAASKDQSLPSNQMIFTHEGSTFKGGRLPTNDSPPIAY